MSPSLFIIVAETLGRLLGERAERGLIEGAEVTSSYKWLTHTQFVDDTILMGAATMENAKAFKRILDLFLSASGGKVNETKSFLYTMNTSARVQNKICRYLGFKQGSFDKPIKYLGAPLSPFVLRSKDWAPLLEKFQKKIEGWALGWLNLAGKVTLIKSVLASYPTFLCSFLVAPKKVLESFEKAMRSFLWKGGREK
eukprot:Gb_09004 [translate_table: standard]